MFGLFGTKYRLLDTEILRNMTDCHCHILPGVDDGIRCMEDSLAVLAEYEKAGFNKVWLTPHIMEDMPNTTEKLRQRYEELCQAYNGPLELVLSAENMIDSLFVERLAKGDVLPYGVNGKELLLETSYVQAPYGFHKILQDVRKAGYTPVLAHPERYVYMSEDDYETLRNQGVYMQLNLFSLTGAYGKAAQKRAEHLLENGYYIYLGTDLHNLQSFKVWLNKKTLTAKAYELLTLSR